MTGYSVNHEQQSEKEYSLLLHTEQGVSGQQGGAFSLTVDVVMDKKPRDQSTNGMWDRKHYSIRGHSGLTQIASRYAVPLHIKSNNTLQNGKFVDCPW